MSLALRGIMTPSGSDDVGRRVLAWVLALRQWIDAVRVREHLRRTERALRGADVTGLDPRRLERRERALDRLGAYRRRGRVPTNRATRERAPQFVGANGVPCALGALALADGERELVEEVSATDNAVRVEDLDGGPLVEWLERTGLRPAEAARIQPSYPTAVKFATDCGPVTCALARALASTVALAGFAVAEYVGYRLVGDLFPDNPLKRRTTLGYVTVLNLLLAPLLGIVCYALFP
jgi:hypothetical protein